MITEVFDPVTDEGPLTVYCEDIKNNTVNRAYPQKAIADIQRDFKCDEDTALKHLQNSDIDCPVMCDGVWYWVE